MAENIDKPIQETGVEVQKAGTGLKFQIPRKLMAVVIVSLAILGTGIGVAVYQFKSSQVTTTGAIITPSTPAPNDPNFELDKLLDMGEVAGNGFQIKNVSRSTEVAVFLDKPYDQNQTKFEAWLKANGYTDIPQDKIVFFHNP